MTIAKQATIRSGVASKSVDRRTMLKGSAAFTAMAGGALVGTGSAIAATQRFGGGGSCATQHARMSRNLSDLLMDFDLGIDAKNIALRSTHCPDCGTRIVPVNDFVA